MRYALVLVLVVGCAKTVKPPPPTDDLELDQTMEQRTATHTQEPADAGVAGVQLEVVDETPPPDGPRIDLAVRDADVADVMRMIAAAAKISIVVSDDVKAKVTLDVRKVTWRQAIDVIAQLEGLDVVEQDGIVMVTRTAR